MKKNDDWTRLLKSIFKEEKKSPTILKKRGVANTPLHRKRDKKR